MTIEADSEHKWAVHVESGLRVEWLGDEPAQERKSHFRIVFEDKEIPFESYYDYGEKEILKENPNISPDDLSDALMKKLVKNYHAQNISGAFDRQLFVEVWRSAVSERGTSFKYSTFYSEWTKCDLSDIKNWSSPG